MALSEEKYTYEYNQHKNTNDVQEDVFTIT